MVWIITILFVIPIKCGISFDVDRSLVNRYGRKKKIPGKQRHPLDKFRNELEGALLNIESTLYWA